MMNSKSARWPVLIAACLGLFLGLVLALFFTGAFSFGSKGGGEALEAAEKKPLYWAAPMDANYRQDKPGLSPMGMALIPVYEVSAKANDAGPGTIHISPDVINNMGVRTVRAVRKTLNNTVHSVGYVQYDENKLVHIHPRVSGWIENLYVKAAGDPVEKGMALYSLYSPELVNAQDELVLAVTRGDTRLIRASEDRLKALQISDAFVTELKRSLNIQQTIKFYAPQSGVVDKLNIREGFFVKPGTTLLSIGSLDQVWVEAEIFERQSALVKTNDPVTMTLDYLPGREWHGKVDYIYPSLNSKTRTLRLRLRFENKQHELKPNMFALVTVHAQHDENVLVIPREALIRTGRQDRVVLDLGEGRFKSMAVKVGRLMQEHAEILEGIHEGEHVVNSAQFLLDSESSKNSDFKRMHHGLNETEGEVFPSARVSGLVNTIDREHRLVKIHRGPIEKWQRAAASVDFIVDAALSLDAFVVGETIEFTFEIKGGEFRVIQLHDSKKKSHEKMQTSHSTHIESAKP